MDYQTAKRFGTQTGILKNALQKQDKNQGIYSAPQTQNALRSSL